MYKYQFTKTLQLKKLFKALKYYITLDLFKKPRGYTLLIGENVSKKNAFEQLSRTSDQNIKKSI